MGHPGYIIITTIITTGHRITGRHYPAAHPGRHRSLQKDKWLFYIHISYYKNHLAFLLEIE